MNPPIEQLTVQNYDLQFGTNVLGHYLFSKPLIPLMETTTAPLPAMQPVCLVKLASSVHLLNHFTSKELINYDTLQLGEARDANRMSQLYSQSKSVIYWLGKISLSLLFILVCSPLFTGCISC